MNDEITMLEEWMGMDKCYFKILAITTVLADSNLAFRGKISDLCNGIGIQSSSVNVTKIKRDIEFLESNNYIKILRDNGIYTISLAKAAEKSKNIIKIKKAWYELIKADNNPAAWESKLKVFLSLLEQPKDEPITYAQIGSKLGLSKSTVERCVKALVKIDFGDFMFKKKEVYFTKDGEIRTVGQTYEKVIDFSK